MYLGKHEDFSKKETISCPLKFDKYKDYWSYNIKSFILNNTLNEIKSEKTFQFIFDTASNSIVLPEEYFNDIKNNLAIFGCKYVTSGNIGALTYNLACEDETKLPNIKRFNKSNFGGGFINCCRNIIDSKSCQRINKLF